MKVTDVADELLVGNGEYSAFKSNLNEEKAFY
jgi:hypothetical protein